MTEHEYEMVKGLCARISQEHDSVAFIELVTELDTLLEKLAIQRARRLGIQRTNPAD